MGIPLILSSVPAATPYIQYISTNGQTVFPYPFPITQDSDLIVVVSGVALNTDQGYTLSGQGNSTGGNVTFTLGQTAGAIVTLFRDIAIQRVSQIAQNSGFSSTVFNAEYNNIYLILQQLQESIALSLQIPNTNNPAPTTTLTPSAYANKYLAFDANGNPTPAALVSGTLTQAIIGGLLTPATPAELNVVAGAPVVNPFLEVGNVRRYGIVPNSTGAAAANTTILTALLNPSIANGPTGLVYLQNTGGAATPDIYYFSNTPIQVRDGVVLDLNGCTMNFSGSFTTNMNLFGFLTFIRDVTVQNGTIVVNYNGTTGTNNGSAMRIGSRSGYAFGTYNLGIFDQDDLLAHGLPMQGNILLSNLRINTNNPAAHIILGLGGMRGVRMENVWLDGGGVCLNNGFYYEYGWSSTNGTPGTQNLWTSSHMTASSFRNIMVTNLAQGGTSQGFGFNGAYDCIVEGIYVNGADQAYGFGTGEAMFYRVWAQDAVSPARQLTLRNLTGLNLKTVALSLGGATPVGSNYLSAIINALPTAQKFQAQTDLLSFAVDGFSLTVPTATGTCVQATGSNVALRNGTCVGGTVQFGAEAMNCVLENVSVLNSGGPNGVRFGFPAPIWSPTRNQMFAIRNCKIAGSAGAGIATSVCVSGIIENNQIGYNTTNDVATEATQTNGVSLAATSFGVKCRGNSITTASAAAAYNSVNGTIDNRNSIEDERITQTLAGGGAWDTDFQSASAQVIGSAGTITATSFKFIRLAPAGAVTGVIMPAGQKSGQLAYLFNESVAGSTITMAVAGTSRVADGVSCIVTGLTLKVLVWDSGTSLWYHS